MEVRRRDILEGLLRGLPVAAAATLLPGLSAAAEPGALPLSPGPFTNSRASLARYQTPGWFADAKFGIWSHWGPQSAIEAGDWYARNMYVQGSPQNLYHCETFGHPSKVGYKDLIGLFTASKWDPDYLIDLYVRAGAKYFVSMGVHHDNFDLWASKHQPRFNATAMGPKRDIVRIWADAARKRGLYFGVSEHLSNSFDWLLPAHLSDSTGPFAGVPYDGSDPAYADLYHSLAGMPADFATVNRTQSMGRIAPERWQRQYFDRVKDLIDQHAPDLIYTDGGISFESYGLGTVAELYNVSAARHGRSQAIYLTKHADDLKLGGTGVLDRERGIVDGINPLPWQSDTCIGGWHYRRGAQYKTPKKVIDLLVDIVSRNGNLLLNIPLPASGQPDILALGVLEGITRWMAIHGEGIYATRPWTIFGEGPGAAVAAGEGFNESKKPELGADDVRFTTKGKTIYAFVMGWPKGQAAIRALGAASPQRPGAIRRVTLLGSDAQLTWQQTPDALRIDLPGQPVSDIGHCFRIERA